VFPARERGFKSLSLRQVLVGVEILPLAIYGGHKTASLLVLMLIMRVKIHSTIRWEYIDNKETFQNVKHFGLMITDYYNIPFGKPDTRAVSSS
jgi:hypothetical protein